jgi:hypothetical protein
MAGLSCLTPGMAEAEVIYTRAVWGKRYTLLQACTDARVLEASDAEAARYLKHLLQRLQPQGSPLRYYSTAY